MGHETDFSICDFVADLRAPTPSAAAELCTPDQAVLKAAFDRLQRQLRVRVESRLQQDAQKLDHLAHRLQQRHPATRLERQTRQLVALADRLDRCSSSALRERRLRLDSLAGRLDAQRPEKRLAELSQRLNVLGVALERNLHTALASARQRLSHLARTLHAVSPLETIGRGYSVLTTPGGEVVSRTGQVKRGDSISAQVSDGHLDLTVDGTRKP